MNGSDQPNIATETPRAERVARLNDQLRKTGRGGRIVVTRGVRMLPSFSPGALVAALVSYDAFDADNDPHGEPDFGDLELWGAELLWKIDYYDKQLQFGSNDPADPAVTTRVLTIMLASEY
jgi:hypothetical protein